MNYIGGNYTQYCDYTFLDDIHVVSRWKSRICLAISKSWCPKELSKVYKSHILWIICKRFSILFFCCFWLSSIISVGCWVRMHFHEMSACLHNHKSRMSCTPIFFHNQNYWKYKHSCLRKMSKNESNLLWNSVQYCFLYKETSKAPKVK